jgi:hypothetical protein
MLKIKPLDFNKNEDYSIASDNCWTYSIEHCQARKNKLFKGVLGKGFYLRLFPYDKRIMEKMKLKRTATMLEIPVGDFTSLAGAKQAAENIRLIIKIIPNKL